MSFGYKYLLSYQLSKIAFDLGWEFIPQYFIGSEFGRQRDQIYQDLRSHKQNIVEGSAERSLSSKLKLYDVSKSSGQEALEDFEDILRFENLPRWNKNDSRFAKLRSVIEGYSPSRPSWYCLPPSRPSVPSNPSLPNKATITSVLKALGKEGTRRIRRGEGQEEVEIIVNYIIDVLIRAGYVLDRQIDAVEKKHETEGGYNENLLRRRLGYRRQHPS